MNFLAHLYLSGPSEDVQFGNFIGDLIKGSRNPEYTGAIKTGILLHREIDRFTDQHPVVANSKQRVRANQGKFSGVVIDIFYDHYLAKNWEKYHKDSLNSYADSTYQMLQERMEELPPKGQHLLPFMIKQNWLVSYSRIEGIESVLGGMSRRTRYSSNMKMAHLDLEREYIALWNDFEEFFPQLAEHADQYLDYLLNE